MKTLSYILRPIGAIIIILGFAADFVSDKILQLNTDQTTTHIYTSPGVVAFFVIATGLGIYVLGEWCWNNR